MLCDVLLTILRKTKTTFSLRTHAFCRYLYLSVYGCVYIPGPQKYVKQWPFRLLVGGFGLSFYILLGSRYAYIYIYVFMYILFPYFHLHTSIHVSVHMQMHI